MAERYLKIMAIVFFGIAGLSFCVSMNKPGDTYDVSVTQMVDADKGLDLRAVGEVLKKAKTAEEFEKLLNSPDTGVNNLDLNADGKADYIKVKEFGDDITKGFSLTTEVANGEVQEIATIKIQKQGEDKAEVEYHGNQTIYGQNHYYRSSWSPGFGTGLMMGYLFAPHRMYSSPWGWGSYPGYYHSYSTIPFNNYSSRWHNRLGSYNTSSSSSFGNSIRSPNFGRNANSIKARLKNPTASQKSFQSSFGSSARRSGGFGRGFSSRRSSFGRSSRSFGGK
ncbi:MAG: hypothetical protein JW841_09470 [Deltaproteobacteria bacterium]|nr:hypothetical protein [Deltaproteobacteria bacterium]